MEGPQATNLRQRIAAVGWSLAVLAVGYFATVTGVVWVFRALASRVPTLVQGQVGPSLIQAVVGVAVFVPLSLFVGRHRLLLTSAELGWVPARIGVPGFGKGLLVAGLMGIGAVVAGIAAHSSWTGDGGSVGSYLVRVPMLSLVLLPAALFEEVAFRGLLVVGLVRGLGRPLGVGVAAMLFAAAHRNNPDVTPLALGNIALAGIFLGATFLARGGLWTATGAHLGWNLTLAGLGAPVSGLPFEIPWIDFNPGALAWLTGGLFGPEGGLLATVALIAGTVVVTRWQAFQEER